MYQLLGISRLAGLLIAMGLAAAVSDAAGLDHQVESAPTGFRGVVTSTVKDNPPVPGAIIQYIGRARTRPGMEQDKTGGVVTTRPDGTFEVTGIAPGTYLVAARADGLTTENATGDRLYDPSLFQESGSLRIPVFVSSGRVARLDIVMRAEAAPIGLLEPLFPVVSLIVDQNPFILSVLVIIALSVAPIRRPERIVAYVGVVAANVAYASIGEYLAQLRIHHFAFLIVVVAVSVVAYWRYLLHRGHRRRRASEAELRRAPHEDATNARVRTRAHRGRRT